MRIRSPSGDHQTPKFSPWLKIEAGVRVSNARSAEGCENRSVSYFGGWDCELTRPDQTATVLRVRVQKRNFRGLGTRATTCSEGILGSPGMVARFLADVVGKYMGLGPKIDYYTVLQFTE